MLAAFRTLENQAHDEVVADEPADGQNERSASPPSKPPMKVSVREAIETFEDRFVSACRGLTASPIEPDEVLAYAGMTMQMSFRFRGRDPDRASLWAAIDRYVGALLGPRRSGPPVLSLLRAADKEALAPVVSQLVGLIALLQWRDGGGRLDGEGSSTRVTTSGPLLRESLATAERYGWTTDAVLPKSMVGLVPDAEALVSTSLAALRQIEPPSGHVTWLRAQVYRVHRREVSARDLIRESDHQMTIEERRMLEDVPQRVPKLVNPWIDACPACHVDLHANARQQLAARQLVRCPTGGCGRWLLPSEAT